VRIRVVGFIVVIAALAGGSAGAAGAATVSGSLQVTATTPTSLSFTVNAQRTCTPDEQCDYVAILDEADGTGDCPNPRPYDTWNAWNGNVQNTGPTTEVHTITPRGWNGSGAAAPEKLCLYILADNVYYYVDGTTITEPAGGGGGGTTNPPGTFPLPGTRTGTGTGTGSGTTGTGTGRTGASGTTTPSSSSRTVAVRTVALTKAAVSAKAALKKAYGKKFTQGKRYKAVCRRVGRSRIHVSCAVSWQRSGTWTGTVDVTGAVRGGRQVLVTRVRVRKPKK
jgi:hypothetical protein